MVTCSGYRRFGCECQHFAETKEASKVGIKLMEHELINESLPSYFSGFCSPGSDGTDAICRNVWTLCDTKVNRLHFHNCIEIALCLSGTGSFYLDKHVYRFEPGDIQVVFPYQPHYSVADEKEQCVWSYLYVEPYKLFLQTDFSNIMALRRLLSEEIKAFGLFKKEEHPEMYGIVTRLDKAVVRASRHKKELCATLLYELLLYMADLDVEQAVARASKGKNEYIHGIVEIVEKINQRVHSDGAASMRVEELARECNMSLSNFRVAFKRVTGFPPKEYITIVRLNYAEHLLLDTDYSIRTIAEKVGFPTSASFHDKFLKAYGVTPKKYRDSAAL